MSGIAKAASGLQAGDRVLDVDGAELSGWDEFRADHHSESPGKPLTLTVLRDGEQQTMILTPVSNEHLVTDEQGKIVNGPDGQPLTETVGVVGVGRLAGEIVSMDEAPVSARAQTMFGLLGSLNVALFVFNLVPLMPLDGGHVAGALYEGAKRGWARIRRRPDPGPVDTAKMVPVTFVVVIVLGAMSLLLAYADIVKPLTLTG